MEITSQNIDTIIDHSWQKVKDKVENKNFFLSSEKTLCFLFAMEIYSQVGDSLVIDFENRCYEGLEGESKYLDLLFFTNNSYKIAIEFKLPKKSKKGNGKIGYSNQTETREAVYRDIARLHWLKKNNIDIKACYFLMAANENPYLNFDGIKDKSINEDFITKQDHIIDSSNILIVKGISMEGISCKFDWVNISKTDQKYKINGKYAWLNPIKI